MGLKDSRRIWVGVRFRENLAKELGLHCNHCDMLFVCHFYWPSFLGTVISSYPKKISTFEYKLQVISQPVLFIACLFSLSVVCSVKSLDCIIFCHFAAHMKINLTCK